jgi:ATP-dependent DNA helicase Rep
MKISAHKFEHRTHFKDYAILYRGNHQARLFEQQLRNHKIPYAISGGRSFFENAEIKDLCSYLRLIANEDDDLAFIRSITVPRRGIGPATIEALGRYAANRHISLFTAVFEEGAAEHVAARQLEGLREFCHLHQPHRPPRPAGARRAGHQRHAQGHQLRGLAVRKLRTPRSRNQVEQRGRLHRLAGP